MSSAFVFCCRGRASWRREELSILVPLKRVPLEVEKVKYDYNLLFKALKVEKAGREQLSPHS